VNCYNWFEKLCSWMYFEENWKQMMIMEMLKQPAMVGILGGLGIWSKCVDFDVLNVVGDT
jgi:hypothetical protein